MSDQDFEMGQISARLDVGDQRHEENKERLDAIESTLKELVEAVTLARGGIRMLFAVGTVAAMAGAFARAIMKWAVEHIK
jgi:hypothetical protein